ncbi:hypothetical protein [Reyranella sp.]|jgi:hypothetical protein|uniref:hypothetical protein n=1 Tax=Reyranella sp. TaxID=1929291 RepID=UPI000BCE2C8F|nr:hypothetical protein [Reyranella sp.]OYY40464.1 MAG: hypothetical protein B7Y57_17290 [Rhodospirillales bacterium 35-66-84]OYZ93081.1 MAG: hypothetical protein B7Y08_18540 [Rhodospirillales bacterium 24-66-33]OZB24209.1 MAG: hypothetical protein B7X63_16500 [Rhodospirillales bacterium 39-66-50]HQS18805.1 hypothetical protein [Reyranella sp.]HQT14886.1 hypothetical protein [Reyranella sp.]
MGRRSAAATQADITRMIKAAIAAGVGKEHIVIRKDREGVTMQFSDQKVVPFAAQAAADEAPKADDSWSDVDAA